MDIPLWNSHASSNEIKNKMIRYILSLEFYINHISHIRKGCVCYKQGMLSLLQQRMVDRQKFTMMPFYTESHQ